MQRNHGDHVSMATVPMATDLNDTIFIFVTIAIHQNAEVKKNVVLFNYIFHCIVLFLCHSLFSCEPNQWMNYDDQEMMKNRLELKLNYFEFYEYNPLSQLYIKNS